MLHLARPFFLQTAARLLNARGTLKGILTVKVLCTNWVGLSLARQTL